MVCDARQTEVGRRWGGLGFYLEHYKKRLMEVQGVRSWATWLAHEIAQVFSRDKDSLHMRAALDVIAARQVPKSGLWVRRVLNARCVSCALCW